MSHLPNVSTQSNYELDCTGVVSTPTATAESLSEQRAVSTCKVSVLASQNHRVHGRVGHGQKEYVAADGLRDSNHPPEEEVHHEGHPAHGKETVQRHEQGDRREA